MNYFALELGIQISSNLIIMLLILIFISILILYLKVFNLKMVFLARENIKIDKKNKCCAKNKCDDCNLYFNTLNR